MGCCHSKSRTAPEYVSNTAIDKRVREALRELKQQQRESASVSSDKDLHKPERGAKHFNRIILRFPIIKRAFSRVRAAFNAFDADGSGSIEYDELQRAMSRLGANCSASDVREIFQEASIYSHNKLTFREFLVCLAIGYVLDMIPSMAMAKEGSYLEVRPAPSESPEPRGEATLGDSARSNASGLFGQGQQIGEAFQTVVDAYMIFDEDSSGTIEREEVIRVFCRSEGSILHQPGAASSQGLSEERWRELDADNDGFITFAEFLYGVATWVGMEEEDDEEDE